jgi:hypothetical protein
MGRRRNRVLEGFLARRNDRRWQRGGLEERSGDQIGVCSHFFISFVKVIFGDMQCDKRST